MSLYFCIACSALTRRAVSVATPTSISMLVPAKPLNACRTAPALQRTPFPAQARTRHCPVRRKPPEPGRCRSQALQARHAVVPAKGLACKSCSPHASCQACKHGSTAAGQTDMGAQGRAHLTSSVATEHSSNYPGAHTRDTSAGTAGQMVGPSEVKEGTGSRAPHSFFCLLSLRQA